MRSCVWAGVLAFWCFDALAGQAAGDLVGIGEYNTESGKIEVHVLTSATQYQQSLLDVATPWGQTSTPPNWTFRMSDVDGDGLPDLVGIANYGMGSGRVEVHALSGASNYQQSLIDVATPWGQTPNPPNWTFDIANMTRICSGCGGNGGTGGVAVSGGAIPSASSPTKEYVYFGGHIIAIENR